MILGAQLFTVRKQCESPEAWNESLKKIADIGYKYIQLTAKPEYDVDFMAEKCKEYGLQVVLTHMPADKILGEIDTVIENHRKLGCNIIGIGSIPGFRKGFSGERVDNFIKDFTPSIERIHEAGMQFSYHNHDMEFARLEDKSCTYLDYLCEQIPAEKMIITLDTYWAQAGGADPAAYIRKLKGRMPCVHFKDMAYHAESEKIRIASIGEGNMNYDAIIEACLETGVEYGFVELDDCYGEDPFECLARSYKFLTERYGLN